MSTFLKALSGIFVVVTFVPTATGALITADLSGTRTESSGQLITTGNWNLDGSSSAATNFTIQWNITSTGTSYIYTYTFSGFNPPDASHVDIAASTTFTSANLLSVTGSTNIIIDQLMEGSFSFWGIKLDSPLTDGSSPFTITIETTREPVWGSFYVKAGDDESAYNSGLTISGLANSETPGFNPLQWVAVPDTTDIPEPASLSAWLLGGGAFGLLVCRRRKKHHGSGTFHAPGDRTCAR